MKRTLVLLLALSFVFCCKSQVQQNYGNNNINIQKVVGPVTIQNSQNSNLNQCLLKIYSNTMATVYVDGEAIGASEINKPLKKSLSAGQYQLKIQSFYHEDDIIIKDVIINKDMLGTENSLYIYFKIDGDLIALRSAEKNKFCYVNRITCEQPTLKHYVSASSFKDGLAIVSDNGKFGLIDYTGVEVVELKFETLKPFENGLAIASIDGKYGMINKTGKTIIPFIYSKINPFVENLARAENTEGKVGFINRNGDTIIPFKYNDAKDFRNGYGIVALNGLKIRGVFHWGDWGVIDQNGNVVIPVTFQEIFDIPSIIPHEGTFVAKTFDTWKFYDQKGYRKLQLKYDETIHNPSGGFIIKKKKKYGLLREDGIELLPPKYDSIIVFSDNNAAVYQNGKVAIYQNTSIGTFAYDFVYCVNDAIGIVSKNGKCAYINHRGTEITQFKYDYFPELTACTFFTEQVVKIGNKFGVINFLGQDVIAVCYDSIILRDFKLDYHNSVRWIYEKGHAIAIVKQNGKYGLVDRKGEMLTEIKYDEITPFGTNTYKLKLERKTAIVDYTGKVLIDFSYLDKKAYSDDIVEMEFNGIKSYYLLNGKCLYNCPINK